MLQVAVEAVTALTAVMDVKLLNAAELVRVLRDEPRPGLTLVLRARFQRRVAIEVVELRRSAGPAAPRSHVPLWTFYYYRNSHSRNESAD